jgi:hypothetical protein
LRPATHKVNHLVLAKTRFNLRHEKVATPLRWQGAPNDGVIIDIYDSLDEMQARIKQ